MGKIRINLNFILILSLYRVGLDLIYNNYLTDLYGYYGFRGEESPLHLVSSWMIFVLSILIVSNLIKINNKISSTIIMILYLISFVPFTSMLAFDAMTNSFYIVNIIYWVVIVISYKIVNNIKFLNVKRFNNWTNQSLIWGIGGCIFLLMIYISWRYSGFRFIFNLFDVYSIRGEIVNRLPSLLQYLYLASNAITPILLIYSLIEKIYPLSFFIVFIQLLSFGINGNKSVFFMIVLTIGIYFILHKNLYIFLCKSVTALTWLSIIEYLILNSNFLIDFIIRRIMFVPNLINSYYFDFFTKNTPDFYKQSILSNFGIQSSYDRIPLIIGDTYFNIEGIAANSGLISDAVQNLGIFGVFFAPFLLTILFKIIDEVSEGLDYKIVTVTSLYLAIILISSTLFTSLLTHGILAIILVLYLLPKDDGKYLLGVESRI